MGSVESKFCFFRVGLGFVFFFFLILFFKYKNSPVSGFLGAALHGGSWDPPLSSPHAAPRCSGAGVPPALGVPRRAGTDPQKAREGGAPCPTPPLPSRAAPPGAEAREPWGAGALGVTWGGQASVWGCRQQGAQPRVGGGTAQGVGGTNTTSGSTHGQEAKVGGTSLGGGGDTLQMLARSGHYPLNAIIFLYIYICLYIYMCLSIHAHTQPPAHTHTRMAVTHRLAPARAGPAPARSSKRAPSDKNLPKKIRSAVWQPTASPRSRPRRPLPRRCRDDARPASRMAHSRSPSSLLPATSGDVV